MRKSTDIEIRLNKAGKLGKCVICGEDSQDPFYGGGCQIGLPELFLSEGNLEEWVCIFCAKYYAPQLSVVIRLARAAEDYCVYALGKATKKKAL